MKLFYGYKRMLARLRAWLERRKKPKGVFYINGADTLPHPLAPEEEAALLSRLPADAAARDLLIEHNLRLVAYIAKKFENTGVGIEELISIGTLGLIKAIGTFHPDRSIKLATYASRCIENEILMTLRKMSTRRGEVSIDEPLHVDYDGNELLLSDILGSEGDTVSESIETAEEKKIIEEAVKSLSRREREIIELRFGLGGRRELTQKETAKVLGISQSYISRLEKKIIERLKKEISGKI